MNYWRYLLITFLLTSCHEQNQAINLEPSFSKLSASTSQYNKNLNLKVIDQRLHPDFIGFRQAASSTEYKNLDNNSPKKSSKITKLTNDQDLAALVKNNLITILQKRGFRFKRFTPNQVKITIVELSFVHKGFHNVAHSIIKVNLSNRIKDLEKIYQKEIISDQPLLHGLTFGIAFNADESYYNEIINNCLAQNINDVINDESLWHFLD